MEVTNSHPSGLLVMHPSGRASNGVSFAGAVFGVLFTGVLSWCVHLLRYFSGAPFADCFVWLTLRCSVFVVYPFAKVFLFSTLCGGISVLYRLPLSFFLVLSVCIFC